MRRRYSVQSVHRDHRNLGLKAYIKTLKIIELYASLEFYEHNNMISYIDALFGSDLRNNKKDILGILKLRDINKRDELIKMIDTIKSQSKEVNGDQYLELFYKELENLKALKTGYRRDSRLIKKYRRYHELRIAADSDKTYTIVIHKKINRTLEKLMKKFKLKTKDEAIKFLIGYRNKNSRISDRKRQSVCVGGPFGENINGKLMSASDIKNIIDQHIMKDVILSKDQHRIILDITGMNYRKMVKANDITSIRIKADTMYELYCLRDITSIISLINSIDQNEIVNQLQNNDDLPVTSNNKFKNDAEMITYLITFFEITQKMKNGKGIST